MIEPPDNFELYLLYFGKKNYCGRYQLCESHFWVKITTPKSFLYSDSKVRS